MSERRKSFLFSCCILPRCHVCMHLYNNRKELLLFVLCRAMRQDEAVNKTTYPKLMGMDGARKEARR